MFENKSNTKYFTTRGILHIMRTHKSRTLIPSTLILFKSKAKQCENRKKNSQKYTTRRKKISILMLLLVLMLMFIVD